MQKIRIGVLMGGKSIEREVSLNSGRTICDHLDSSCYTVVPLFQTANGTLYNLPWVFLHRGKTSDFEHRLESEAQRITWDSLKETIDFMYIALHGRYGEDGTLQGLLEVLQIPYLGSKIFASALGMHKGMQKKVLSAAGISVPAGVVVPANDITNNPCNSSDSEGIVSRVRHSFSDGGRTNSDAFGIALAKSEAFTLPLIVKPVQEGSSCGVTKVMNQEELVPALQKAAYTNVHHAQDVIIEEYIEGMEFSCIIITDYVTGELIALPPTEIVIEKESGLFNYEQKYMPGRATKHTPARCSDDALDTIKTICKKVFIVLGFENFARIDGFLQNNGEIVITDPNSFSGMSPSSYAFLQAAEIGMSHTALINHLVATELHAYGMLENSLTQQKKESSTMMIKKIRIAVLLGGASHEREISLESGRNVSYKLSPQKYEITTLFVTGDLQLYAIPAKLLVRNTTREIEDALTSDMKILWNDLSTLFDFIFIALHGGAGENGSVQGMLEMLGMPYNGSSVLASALCMDKFKTNQFLRTQGFEVPNHYLLSRAEFENVAYLDTFFATLKTLDMSGVVKSNNGVEKSDIDPLISSDSEGIVSRNQSGLRFPLIVKPHDDGCSVMVKKVKTEEELSSACKEIFKNGKEQVLIEECIQGMELTVGVIGNHKPIALPPSEAVCADGILSIEEKFLPGAGENQTPARLPAEKIRLVQEVMEKVYVEVGCKGYVRIDCFYQTAEQSPTGVERVVVLEINSLPGLTPATCLFHQAAEIGIKPMDFIDLIVQLGFEQHTQQAYLSHEQSRIFEHQQS